MKTYLSKSVFHIFALFILLGVSFGIQPVTTAYAVSAGSVEPMPLSQSGANTASLTPSWNTFLGGSETDYGGDMVIDSSGNIFVLGISDAASWGNPIRPHSAGSDVYVAKLDASGNLIWNTFLGGSGIDYGRSIAIDSSGNIFVVGTSSATWGRPIRHYVADMDAFAAKLNPSGNMMWNTFLGGSEIDYGDSIAVNGGYIFVAGTSDTTWGSPTRPYSAGDDVFAAKLDSSTGRLGWNSFMGGSGGDSSTYIGVNDSGFVFMAGRSSATWGNPPSPFYGAFGCFAAKLNASNGSLSWNTFVNGNMVVFCSAAAMDKAGNMFLLINDSNGPDDTLAVKVDFLTGNTDWGIYLGGYGHLVYGSDMTVDKDGNVFVSGYSDGIWGDPVQPPNAGVNTFVAKLDGLNGHVFWNTFVGGDGDDSDASIVTDGNGNVFMAGISDAAWGNPKRPYTADFDVFVHKVGLDITPPKVLSIARASQNPSRAASVNFTVTFSETVFGAYGNDFNLTTTGVTGASITSVYGAGTTRTVIVNTGSGDGTIRLNVNPSGTSIKDIASNPLSGGFTSGQIYTINKQPIKATFTSIAVHDGWVRESSETSNMGGAINATAPTLLMGDNAIKNQFRSILSFNTSNLPDTAILTGVELKVKKQSIVGPGDPQTIFQVFATDIKNGFFGSSAFLQISDFQDTASTTIGLINPALVNNWYKINLIIGKDHINKLSTNAGLTQIRLRFKLDDNNDAVANYLSLYSGNATNAADRPQLVVTYYVP